MDGSGGGLPTHVNLGQSGQFSDQPGSQPALGFQAGWDQSSSDFGVRRKSPGSEFGILRVSDELASWFGDPVAVPPLTRGRDVDINPRDHFSRFSLNPNIRVSGWGSAVGYA